MMNIGIGGKPKRPKRIEQTRGDRERARLLHELARQFLRRTTIPPRRA